MIDPLGGIWTLWPLFGTSNQMLAAIALILCTVVLFKMKRQRYAWVTIVPATWLVICTVTAGLEKVFHSNPAVGFLAHASRFGNAVASGQVLAPAKSLAEMSRIMEVMRTYTHISTLMQQQNDLQKTAIEKLADVPA